MISTRKSLISLISAAGLFLWSAGAQAATRNVPSATYPTIQSAITAAAAGDTIVVAAGTYRESVLWFNKNLLIQGAGVGQSIIDPSVAGGGHGGQCLYTLNLTSASHIQGFTFQNGSFSVGAGVYNSSSSPTYTDCAFIGNIGVQLGGGMYNQNSSPSLTNCTFSNNTITSGSGAGGGMLNLGSSSPALLNCTFSGNSSANVGGAMSNSSGCNPIMTNCTFNNNTAFGGGGIVNTAGSTVKITNCIFSNNAASYGGGMYNSSTSPILTNCTFTKNTAANWGGGIYSFGTSSPNVTNCILWGNTAGSRTPGIIGSATVSYSDLQDLANSTPDANGNFSADPLFVDAPNDDLHLQAGSPCIDAGQDTAVPSGVTTDLDGNARLLGAHVDLGAYERQNLAPIAHDDIVTAVKNTALIIPVLSNDSDPENDPLSVLSTTPAAHGTVTINNDGTITYKPTGGYLGADTFTYTISDGHGGQSTATVYVNVALQTSVLVTNASCVGTGSVALYARLVQGTVAGKTNLISGQPLLFLVNGTPIGSGITDAYGKASVNFLPSVPGSFILTVQFTGSGTYAPSTGTGTLTVSPSATDITLQPTGGQAGGGTTIQGRLARTSSNQGLVGMSVTVSVDGTVVGTVTTGVDGFFTCAYSIPSGATVGAHTVTASFGGTALNSPSSGSATLTVAP